MNSTKTSCCNPWFKELLHSFEGILKNVEIIYRLGIKISTLVIKNPLLGIKISTLVTQNPMR